MTKELSEDIEYFGFPEMLIFDTPRGMENFGLEWYNKSMEKLENQNQEKIITIKDLLHGQSTIRQLDILAKADRLFADKKGRYYGGVLTEEEMDTLDPDYRKRSQ